MDESGAKIIVRPATGDDKNFILSTWLKGNYYGNSYFSQIPQDLYFKEYAKHILEILSAPEVRADVACDELTPGWIVGFCVYKRQTLYWVHVKKDYRAKGIATLLLKGKQIEVTKGTSRVGRAITEAKRFIFNPF